MVTDRLGFKINSNDLVNWVFIPKYYNPEIQQRLQELSQTHNLVVFDDLVRNRFLSLGTGDEIGKMAYGTGNIPFIRTSDISNWEIKADPKQGVAEDIFSRYSKRQDVRESDIFFVRDGTYLIGQTCMVTKHDLPCLYQSHIVKIRVNDTNPIDKYLFFAAMNAPVVKRQIRSRQFTADIIDTVGNRFLEITFPIPKDASLSKRIIVETRSIIAKRAALRESIRRIPWLAQGFLTDLDGILSPELLLFEEAKGNPGFKLRLHNIANNIFVPKYHDPHLEKDLRALSQTHDLISLGEFVKRKVITWNTGIEVGKMAYGTGPIAFIRTSDITNWELKSDPKQNVSEEIYGKNKQDVRAEDILVVRDGTYLVGVSCIITESDTKILYASGLYKLRVLKKNALDPYLLLALLNTPIVKRQIRAKQFTRDIIDTVGKRLFDVLIPIPKDRILREKTIRETRDTIESRTKLRNRAREIALEIEGITKPKEQELEVLEEI